MVYYSMQQLSFFFFLSSVFLFVSLMLLWVFLQSHLLIFYFFTCFSINFLLSFHIFFLSHRTRFDYFIIKTNYPKESKQINFKCLNSFQPRMPTYKNGCQNLDFCFKMFKLTISYNLPEKNKF